MIEEYVNAEQLKRLISTLVVILGCLVIAALFAVIVLPGLRNANKPKTSPTIAPVARETGWLNEEEFPPQKGSVVPPVDPQTLIAPTAGLIERGKVLFQKDCTQCHGPLGHGDGPAANTMNPKPRNFTSAEGWTNGPDMPAIYKTISEGVKGTSMNSFDYLTEKDRMALVHYVQSLGSFPRKAPSPEALAALTKQLGSAGGTIPNRIPVSSAIAKLSAEYIAPRPLVIPREDQSPGAVVLRRILWDPDRAARFLAYSQSWKSSTHDLASSLLLDTPENGFSVNSATLSAPEWQALYVELLKCVNSR